MSEVNGSGFIVFHALLEAALSERLMDVSLRTRYTSADGTDTDTGDGFRATDGNYGTFFFSGLGCAETKAGPKEKRRKIKGW